MVKSRYPSISSLTLYVMNISHVSSDKQFGGYRKQPYFLPQSSTYPKTVSVAIIIKAKQMALREKHKIKVI